MIQYIVACPEDAYIEDIGDLIRAIEVVRIRQSQIND